MATYQPLKVRVYWNLHRKVWSIQEAHTRLVIAHATKVIVDDVTYTVSDKGRLRVIAEGRKNVHAFAVGTLRAFEGAAVTKYIPRWWPFSYAWGPDDDWTEENHVMRGDYTTYNPRRDTTFVTVDHEVYAPERKPVHEAGSAVFCIGVLGSTIGRPAPQVYSNPYDSRYL